MIGASALENIQTYYNADNRLAYIEATDTGLAASYQPCGFQPGKSLNVLYQLRGNGCAVGVISPKSRRNGTVLYLKITDYCLTHVFINIKAGAFCIRAVLVPVMITGVTGEAKTAVNPYIFVGAALFAYVTVLISINYQITAGKDQYHTDCHRDNFTDDVLVHGGVISYVGGKRYMG